MISVYDKIIANQPICNVFFLKSNCNCLLWSFIIFIRVSQDELEPWRY